MKKRIVILCAFLGILLTGCEGTGSPQGIAAKAYMALIRSNSKVFFSTLVDDAKHRYASLEAMIELRHQIGEFNSTYIGTPIQGPDEKTSLGQKIRVYNFDVTGFRKSNPKVEVKLWSITVKCLVLYADGASGGNINLNPAPVLECRISQIN